MKIKFDDFKNLNSEHMKKVMSSIPGLNQTNGEIVVADDFFQVLLNNTLERGFYNTAMTGMVSFPPSMTAYKFGWVKINRLPVHPSQADEYDLLSRWQSTLSVIHLLGYRLVFVLKRYFGRTSLYLGVADKEGKTDKDTAVAKLIQSAGIHMPGISVEHLKNDQDYEEISGPLQTLSFCGAVTGIPSQRKTKEYALIQTLDKLAFGVRDSGGLLDRNYSLVVVADPVSDPEVSGLIQSMLNLASEIHDKVNISFTEGQGESVSQFQSSSKSISLGGMIGGLFLTAAASALTGGIPLGPMAFSMVMKSLGAGEMLQGAGVQLNGGMSWSKGTSRSYNVNKSLTKQFLNRTAQYCEQLVEKHVKRFEQGRNLGFWNTGVYILADNLTTAESVMGILRSVYSGEETYIEPIRAFSLEQNYEAHEYIRNFNLLPLPVNAEMRAACQEYIGNPGGWHILGSMFEAVSTPLTTEELSISTSLPRRDVPGLKFVRNAVRFASNPPKTSEGAQPVKIGRIVDTGVMLNVNYTFDLNSLTRHSLLTGLTGSGKTTTVKRLLSEVMKNNIPFLVIEPAKTEYVDWAIEYNKQCRPGEGIEIYMPGANEYDGLPVKQIRLNPFQPGAFREGKLNLLNRLEKFQSILMLSLPMTDVLPLLVEEALYELAYAQLGGIAWQNDIPAGKVSGYPLLSELPRIAERIIGARGYEEKVRDNLKAAIKTRITSLLRGWKKDVLNAPLSTPCEELFERKVVINLSRLSGNADKALLMALLMLSLSEYRESKYYYDRRYRQEMKDRNILRHLAVIEEAHRILLKAPLDFSGAGNPQAVVSGMFSDMLSEIRAYGQGLAIVDQVPAKLVPDAIKNTNLKIVHRLVAADDRMAMASCMGLRKDQEDIIAVLEPGNVILCSDEDDAATWVKIQK